MHQYENFPKELREMKQWLLWKKEKRGDKWTKVPYQRDGSPASSTDKATWATFEECIAVVDRFSGLGFVFDSGVVGIDLDHCITNGVVAPWAREILETFYTYTERSPSGEGLHLILRSDVPLPGRKNEDVECYSSGRFFTVTGNVFEERSILEDLDVEDWYRETFPEKKKSTREILRGTGYLPNDQKILRVMFQAKNGENRRQLYEKGMKSTKCLFTSQSQADLSLVSSLMFYSANDMATADRLFRASALMRPKWDEYRGEKTYGQITLESAVSEEVMMWEKPAEGEERFMMSGGKNPVPLLNLENICRAFEDEPELMDRFRLNDFSHTVEILRDGKWMNLQDYDVLETQRYISTRWTMFARISKELTVDTIRFMAHQRKVNPPRDYLEGLVWDGVSRLDTWLMQAYGVNDEEVYRKMGSNWLKGLVKRVLHPGCQFDEVLVLESPQGYRKSTSLRVLGSPWHTESTLSTDDKDFYMLLARNIIVEFSEGDIVGRTSARKLKAIITKTEDSYRPPYEHGMMTFQRGCVFAMTTNDSDYQKDDTGGRRWLPVVLQKIADIDWIETNRDQLFAEAVHRVEVLRETTHEYPTERLTELQEEKREGDPYDELFYIWYQSLPSTKRDSGVILLEAYREVIAKDSDAKLSKQDEWRVGSIFRRVLGLDNKSVRIDGAPPAKRWVKVSK